MPVQDRNQTNWYVHTFSVDRPLYLHPSVAASADATAAIETWLASKNKGIVSTEKECFIRR
jgi:predicted transcriptional regulator